MRNMKLIFMLLLLTIMVGVSFTSCKYDNFEGRFETEIFNKAKSNEGFVWFKYSSVALQKTTGSGHSQPLLKTRYNLIAAQQLDSVGRIKTNFDFKEDAMVVKELLDNNGNVEIYAVLYKNSKHPNADSKGWVWGYYNKDGTARISSSLKGKDCSGCHSQNGNKDYMLMNKYYQ